MATQVTCAGKNCGKALRVVADANDFNRSANCHIGGHCPDVAFSEFAVWEPDSLGRVRTLYLCMACTMAEWGGRKQFEQSQADIFMPITEPLYAKIRSTGPA